MLIYIVSNFLWKQWNTNYKTDSTYCNTQYIFMDSDHRICNQCQTRRRENMTSICHITSLQPFTALSISSPSAPQK